MSCPVHSRACACMLVRACVCTAACMHRKHTICAKFVLVWTAKAVFGSLLKSFHLAAKQTQGAE